MAKFKAGNKTILNRKDCFVISEAGVNHNGSLRLAKKLVDAAIYSGADAVKFQTFKAENVVTETARLAEYQKKNLGKNTTQLEMIKKLELDYGAFRDLKNYCDKKRIIFLSTPHTFDAVDFLEPLVPAYKVGSGDLNNLPFLRKIAKKKKLVILSTGMAKLSEVAVAVEAIKKAGNNKIILLHCTTNYPCPLVEVNLSAMSSLKEKFNLPVGYSDHTAGIIVPVMAVTLGAKVLEKHLTLDRSLSGPDHKASMEPDEFREMVKAVRDAEKVLGSGKKIPTESEKKIRYIVRKSIVACCDIPKDTKITGRMLSIKRPGTGISPGHMDSIIGKTVTRRIRKGSLIKPEDLR
ncbi:MAG: N-acetylneuraminate synthase [Candidatus Omnitrophica bacterium]|nr:N-acetylneuraminate synthase [Candidatus Omnitrophota bacterium]MBD3269396.1 N-acetylneuraminate synthase [Candidatus Omnitrophota bacterium]